MQGKMIVIHPDGAIETKVFARPLDLTTIQNTVGGYIEVIPRFTKMNFKGELLDVVAFCNEEGKLYNLPFNGIATAAWYVQTDTSDVLVGPVAVVTGDKEFMDAL